MLARFIPVAATIIGPLAGTVDVPLRSLTCWQIAGAAIWTAGTTAAGYLAARIFPGITGYLMPVFGLVAAVSVNLALVQVRRARRRRWVAPAR